MAAGHVRGGLCLVDEDEALRIEIELVVEPVLALLQDVGPILLNRMPGHFFARDPAPREGAIHGADQGIMLGQ